MKRLLAIITSFAILNVSYPLTERAHPHSSDATPVSEQVELQRVLEGLDQPIYVTGAADGTGRLFILERAGRIKVLPPDSNLPALFLDITEKVRTGGENGLIGLAFHPQYEENRRFFVCYSRASDGATVIAQYHASLSDPDSAESEENLLLEIPQPSDIHHGGMIEFGPDNFLYISTGDGEWEDPERSAQNVEDLRGKILRIDVDRQDEEKPYSSPEDNSFFGETAGRDEVYALGFRNPWRFSFDRETGGLFVGDVGHEQREEINIVTLGGNYGWRVFEGTRCTNFDTDECDSLDVISPLIEYEHTDGRCSVIGGYVYRGARSSLPLGAYVFADFCTGELLLAGNGEPQLLLDTDLRIVSLGEDDSGEIYVVGLNGTLDRIAQGSEQQPQIIVDSVEIRHRTKGNVLEPVTVKPNGRKYEIIIRGSGFGQGAEIFVGGRRMKTRPGMSPDTELVARLRSQTLARPGPLTVSVANPDGARSDDFQIEIQ